ncbi:hypothetical protein Salat_0844200 [Sesamum alatum]|uniref:Uncharacterized protein n=1 Tax=Sesamum alatum TaxID=300844 RepID=A0AAE1YIH7_9LAMI|nr:hypothetical protein Salat_0844200 [Sesamum alatum]
MLAYDSILAKHLIVMNAGIDYAQDAPCKAHLEYFKSDFSSRQFFQDGFVFQAAKNLQVDLFRGEFSRRVSSAEVFDVCHFLAKSFFRGFEAFYSLVKGFIRRAEISRPFISLRRVSFEGPRFRGLLLRGVEFHSKGRDFEALYFVAKSFIRRAEISRPFTSLRRVSFEGPRFRGLFLLACSSVDRYFFGSYKACASNL